MSTQTVLRVVVDTNILVSANLNPAGLEALVMQLVLSGILQLYVSDPILAEYTAVLFRPRFHFVPREIDSYLLRLREASIIVAPTDRVAASPHEEDNRFLECASAADANVLVSGNKRHFPRTWGTTAVVNARELIDLLGPAIFPPFIKK